jgi:hypothetical protein
LAAAALELGDAAGEVPPPLEQPASTRPTAITAPAASV